MVDLALLQSVSYISRALGVCVGAFYYAMVLRATERNKKIQLSTNIAERLGTKDFLRDYIQLAALNWKARAGPKRPQIFMLVIMIEPIS